MTSKNFFSLKNVFIVFPIIFFLNEKIYMSINQASGTYNSYISIIMLVLIVIVGFLLDIRFTKVQILVSFIFLFLLMITFLLNKASLDETFRYLFDYLLFVIVSKINYINLSVLSKIIIMNGLYYVLTNQNLYFERTAGFFITSPPNFSIVILISMLVLLKELEYKQVNSGTKFLNLICIFVSLYMIYLSETRSVLILALIFNIFYFYKKYIKKHSYKIKFLFFSISILGIFPIYQIFNNILNSRLNGDASTETRFFLYRTVFDALVANPSKSLIGNGPGAAYDLISRTVNLQFPLHFDFLSIMYDLGIIGIVLLFISGRVYYKKTPLSVGLLILLANFHNLIFFPLGIIYISLFWNYLNSLKENKELGEAEFVESIKRIKAY